LERETSQTVTRDLIQGFNKGKREKNKIAKRGKKKWKTDEE
jgi:hypothetical protein